MRKNDRLTLTCERIGADMEGVCFAEDTAVLKAFHAHSAVSSFATKQPVTKKIL